MIKNSFADAAKMFRTLGFLENTMPEEIPVLVESLPDVVRGRDLPVPVRPTLKVTEFVALVSARVAKIANPGAVSVAPSYTWATSVDLPGLEDKPPGNQIKQRIMAQNFPVYGYGWSYAKNALSSPVIPLGLRPEIREALIACSNYYRGNGDWTCVFDRFMRYCAITPVVQPMPLKLLGELTTYLPLNPSHTRYWKAHFASAYPIAVLQDIPLNEDGGMGLPYEMTRQRLMDSNPLGMAAMYKELFKAMADGPEGLSALLRRRPTWFCFTQRAKIELYENKCMTAPFGSRKCRPYFVLNGVIAHAFQALAKPLSKCVVPFLVRPDHPRLSRQGREQPFVPDEDLIGMIELPCGWKFHPTSSSAIGFSWVHGGAQALVEFLYYHAMMMTDGEIRLISYSDDQLWLRKWNNKLWIYTPDVDQMDGRITSTPANMLCHFLMTQFGTGGNLGIWQPLVQLFGQLAVNFRVMIEEGVVIKIVNKLASGIPATTFFDQFGSIFLHNRIRIWNGKPGIKDLSPSEWMNGAAAIAAATNCGMPFKGESLGAVDFLECLTGDPRATVQFGGWSTTMVMPQPAPGARIPAKFLGYEMLAVATPTGSTAPIVWTPWSCPQKAFVSWLRPPRKFTADGATQQTDIMQMTRLRQLYAQAIWHSDALSRVCVAYFITLAARGMRPMEVSESEGDMDSDTATHRLDTTSLFLPVIPGVTWPSRPTVMALYAPVGMISLHGVEIMEGASLPPMHDEYDLSANFNFGGVSIPREPVAPVQLDVTNLPMTRMSRPREACHVAEFVVPGGTVRCCLRGPMRTPEQIAILKGIRARRQDELRTQFVSSDTALKAKFKGKLAAQTLSRMRDEAGYYEEEGVVELMTRAELAAIYTTDMERAAFDSWGDMPDEDEMDWDQEDIDFSLLSSRVLRDKYPHVDDEMI